MARNQVQSGGVSTKNTQVKKESETVKKGNAPKEVEKAAPKMERPKFMLLSVLLNIKAEHNKALMARREELLEKLPYLHLNGATVKRLADYIKSNAAQGEINVAIITSEFAFEFTAERGKSAGKKSSVEMADIAILWNEKAETVIRSIWKGEWQAQQKEVRERGPKAESVKIDLNDLDSLENLDYLFNQTRQKLQADKERGQKLKESRAQKKSGKSTVVETPDIDPEEETPDII